MFWVTVLSLKPVFCEVWRKSSGAKLYAQYAQGAHHQWITLTGVCVFVGLYVRVVWCAGFSATTGLRKGMARRGSLRQIEREG